MADQFGMAKMMLGRCPSCYYNFRSLFCAMTCRPDHSRYLTVKETGTSTLYPGKETIESINYTMADDFAQRILNSCRLVEFNKRNIFKTYQWLFSPLEMFYILVVINIHLIQCVVNHMINVQKKHL